MSARSSLQNLSVHEELLRPMSQNEIDAMHHVSSTISYFVTGPDHPAMQQAMRLGLEAVGVRKDGALFPIEVISRVIPYGGNTVQVATIRDISDRKRVEVALLALGRLVPDGDVVAVTHGGVMYATERRLGASGRGRLSNLGAVWLEVAGDRLRIGDRLDLIDPDQALAIEPDRI